MVVFYMHFFNNPSNLRNACRNGIFTSTTSGHAPGYMQANVVILESSEAIDFSIFCQKNSNACPLLEVLKPGDPEPKRSAPNADIRTDLPLYKIFYNGLFSHETLDILDLWQDNFVTFLIGCSFTAEDALKKEGLSPKHLQKAGNVPMFITNRKTVASGKFYGSLVVSMRPYTPDDAKKAALITSNYPMAHGAPIQIGDADSLGIENINQPDYGSPVGLEDNEIPVFWACGVTPQEAIRNAKPKIAITHSPGCMFVSELKA